MSALYRGETVRVYRTKRNRSQIAYQGMLCWVKTSELEPPMAEEIHADFEHFRTLSAFIAPVSAVATEAAS